MGKRFSMLYSKKGYSGDFQSNLVKRSINGNWEDDFELVDHKPLGEGITGAVLKVRSKLDGQLYAMKTINTAVYNKAQRKELKTEVEIISNLIHPNIVRIYRVYETKRGMNMIMELLSGGDLASRPPTKVHEIIKISFDLLSACRYWHSRNKVHRDLKLDNVLWSSSNPEAVIKIIDFGLGTDFAVQNAKVLPDHVNLREDLPSSRKSSFLISSKSRHSSGILSTSSSKPKRKRLKFNLSPDEEAKLAKNTSKNAKLRRMLRSQVGTPYYIAPEVIHSEKGYQESCDLWSIGVMIYALITRTFPFNGQNEAEVYKAVFAGAPRFDSPNWKIVSPNGHAVQLVKSLLTVDPSKRWSAAEALASPWFKNVKKRSRRKRNKEEIEAALQLEKQVVNSFQKFVNYTKLRRAALMIIAHKADTKHITKLRDLFLEIDIHRTGTILFDELKIALERHGIVGDQVEALFQELDQDKSGQIRYMEFLAATIETQKIITYQEIEEAFEHLDTDSSGFITRKNLQSLLGNTYSKEEVDEIIKESDLTNDGVVSKDEFVKIMTMNLSQEKIRDAWLVKEDSSQPNEPETETETKVGDDIEKKQPEDIAEPSPNGSVGNSVNITTQENEKPLVET